MVTYGVLAVVGIALLVFSFIFDDLLDGLLDFGPDWFSGVSIGTFLAVLGVGGIAGSNMGWNSTTTAVVALSLAVIVSAITSLFAVKIMRGATDRSMTPADLVGVEGRSVLGSPAAAAGEIMLTVHGQPLKVNGRCTEELKPGDRVLVTDASSMTSVTVIKTQ